MAMQEIILHSLHENGVDLDAVESYIKDDIHRLGFRLDTIHERMKTHLTDLLVGYYSTMHQLIFIVLMCTSNLASCIPGYKRGWLCPIQ